jgi:hypothetical protein
MELRTSWIAHEFERRHFVRYRIVASTPVGVLRPFRKYVPDLATHHAR